MLWPATNLRIAILVSIIVGAYAFNLHARASSLALGIAMGLGLGAATFALLRFRSVQKVRQIYLVSYAILMWMGFYSIFNYLGIENLAIWVWDHTKVYYYEGIPTYGTTLVPCNWAMPEIMLGLAVFGKFYLQEEWARFPSTLQIGILYAIPFLVTAFVLGRGFCGWICYFGGTVQACMSGKKVRWKMSKFMKQSSSGEQYIDGLREEVKDVKYGIATGILLLAFAFAVPLICIVCWVWHVQFFWLATTFLLVSIVFVGILPFMNKKRWFCMVICPVGAIINFIEKITPFHVKVDKKICIKCHKCIHVCETYSMTRQSIEESGKPNIDCIKCHRCIEVCPVDCIDMYVRGTEIRARSWFIPLSIAIAASWYAWFVIAIQILPSIFKF
ncbi:4Fe-4S binding protein [[Eubacterium] cellulosolvens]